MVPPSPKPTYPLLIQANPDVVPAVVRLRRTLKHLLWWFELRVIRVEEVPAADRPVASMESDVPLSGKGI